MNKKTKVLLIALGLVLMQCRLQAKALGNHPGFMGANRQSNVKYVKRPDLLNVKRRSGSNCKELWRYGLNTEKSGRK